jgi:hypothetical protein
MADYILTDDGVQRRSDGMWIPDEPLNREWRKYQAWVAEGNLPDPKPLPPAKPPVADRVESMITSSETLLALVRRMAKKESITERALLDEIRAEAKE